MDCIEEGRLCPEDGYHPSALSQAESSATDRDTSDVVRAMHLGSCRVAVVYCHKQCASLELYNSVQLHTYICIQHT